MHSTILSIANRVIGPILIGLSLIALYRGHNLPGGGFIGGLIAASAVILWALALGWDDVKKKIRVDPMTLIVSGMAIAMLSGVPALLISEPFMTAIWGPTWQIPILGKLKLGTPLLFDIGVYLGVIGFSLKCAIALGSENQI